MVNQEKQVLSFRRRKGQFVLDLRSSARFYPLRMNRSFLNCSHSSTAVTWAHVLLPQSSTGALSKWMLPWLENFKWVNHHLNTKRIILSSFIPGVWQFIYGVGWERKGRKLPFKSNGLKSKLLAVTLCKQVSGRQRHPKSAPATPAPFPPPPSLFLPSAYTPLASRWCESEQEKDHEPVPEAGRAGAVGLSMRGAGGTQRPRLLWLISSAFGSGSLKAHGPTSPNPSPNSPDFSLPE